MRILVPNAQPRALRAPPFIRHPPLFGSRLLPQDVGVSRAGSEAVSHPQSLEPPVSVLPVLPSVVREGPSSAAHCRLRNPPPGAAVAAAPPEGAVWWYNRAPTARWLGLPVMQRPLGGSSRLCKEPRPGQLPLLPSILGSSPSPPSLGRPPASWTFEGIPGSPPEGAAKSRLLASALPPDFSIHLFGTRAQSHASPWDLASLQQ